MTAPQAAGVIHSDFEKGFIRAETVSIFAYSEHELMKPGNWKLQLSTTISLAFSCFGSGCIWRFCHSWLSSRSKRERTCEFLPDVHWLSFWYLLLTRGILCFCSWDQREKSTLSKKEMWCFSASTYNRTLRWDLSQSQNIVFISIEYHWYWFCRI